MEPQHMMKFPTSHQKVNKPRTSPDGIQLTARQLETKPRAGLY